MNIKLMIKLLAVPLLFSATTSWGQLTNSLEKCEVYTTAKGTTLRLSPSGSLHLEPASQAVNEGTWIFVDPTKTFQTMLGIGGALTDASAETFAKLPEKTQEELLTAYYNPEKGIGYTLGRTNINSCDFSSGSYTYVANHDTQLKTFSVAHDEKYRIPFIKQAIAAAGGHLTLFVSPWSPPAWMKDNDDMLHGGKLLPQYRQAWANYFVKFIKAYQAHGIPIWGMTVQNEPLAVQIWESCIYTAQEERDFIKNYLGPTLARDGLGSKKIIAWDHNRDLLYYRASVVLEDPDAAKYVWGIGYHWYESWSGGEMMFNNERLVHEAFPNTHLLFTEGCVDHFNIKQVDDWNLGEKYGRSMIHDFNAGTVGWTDWNVLLDEHGGPNHVGNYCFAPIIGDTQSGKLIYTNIYYYIGQFSKFIRPGAKRIISSPSTSQLLTTAFVNKDGSLAVIVMNPTDSKINYHLWVRGKAALTASLPHSIATIIIK